MNDLDTQDPLDAVVREALREDAERAPRLPAEWPGPDITATAPTATRQWSRTRLAVSVAAAVVLVVALAAVARPRNDNAPAAAPPAWIAFVGDVEMMEGDGGPLHGDYLGDFLSDIVIVNEDGSGLHNLTNTPDVNESAPTWSPDGTRLAFLRDLRVGTARLVIFDTTTQTETSDLPVPLNPISDTAGSITWSADGKAIQVHIANSPNRQVELATQSWLSYPQGVHWSPDHRWIASESVSDCVASSHSYCVDLVVRQADQPDLADSVRSPWEVFTSSHDVSQIHFEDRWYASAWSPDGTTLLVSVGTSTSNGPCLPDDEWIDLVEIPDGNRRVFIENAFAPSWSPDGNLVAFLRNPRPGAGSELWVAAADGTQPRQIGRTMVSPTWSTDGSRLLAESTDGLFTIRPDGTGTFVFAPGVHTGSDADCRPTTFQPSSLDAGRPKASPAWQPAPQPRETD